jgi:hypothetical protein
VPRGVEGGAADYLIVVPGPQVEYNWTASQLERGRHRAGAPCLLPWCTCPPTGRRTCSGTVRGWYTTPVRS